MNFKLVVQTSVILLLFSFPALAKNTRPFFLHTTATMNGAAIPAGIYDLRWESQNAKVRVTLWKDGRFVAEARGIWSKGGIKYTEDAALLRVNSDGSRSLVEIRLAGEKRTIVLQEIDPILRVEPRNAERRERLATQ